MSPGQKQGADPLPSAPARTGPYGANLQSVVGVAHGSISRN